MLSVPRLFTTCVNRGWGEQPLGELNILVEEVDTAHAFSVQEHLWPYVMVDWIIHAC